MEVRSKAPQYGHNSLHLCLNQTRLPRAMGVQFSTAPAQAPMKLWLPLCSLICPLAPGAHCTCLVSPLICWAGETEQEPPRCR